MHRVLQRYQIQTLLRVEKMDAFFVVPECSCPFLSIHAKPQMTATEATFRSSLTNGTKLIKIHRRKPNEVLL